MKRSLTDRALPEQLPPWGVQILESHHSPHFKMEWRTHRFLKFIYVLQGQGTIHYENRNDEFETGDLVVVAPGTRNRLEDAPGAAASLYVCCLAKSRLGFDPRLTDWLPTGVLRGDGHFANRVGSTLRRLVHAQDAEETMRPLAMVAEALRLVQLVCERTAKTPRTGPPSSASRDAMKRYIASLPSRFFEATTIEDAARQLNLSRRAFTKMFAQYTGESWLQHVRRLAIEHAQQRLRETDLPIVSVAFECGFNDLSTFYRQFKSQCDVSPARYREQTSPLPATN